MTTSYRDAVPADAMALRELFVDSFVETFGHLYRSADLDQFLANNILERWQASLSDSAVAMRVAEEHGEIIGFVELAPKQLPHKSDAPTLELRKLYLKSSAKGRGVADELMKWALAEAARRGAQELILSVYVDNHRARRFYQRYGFEVVGRYDFMVGSHADEDLILRHHIMHAQA